MAFSPKAGASPAWGPGLFPKNGDKGPPAPEAGQGAEKFEIPGTRFPEDVL